MRSMQERQKERKREGDGKRDSRNGNNLLVFTTMHYVRVEKNLLFIQIVFPCTAQHLLPNRTAYSNQDTSIYILKPFLFAFRVHPFTYKYVV